MDAIFKWDNLQMVLGEIGTEIRNLYQDKLIRDDKIASGDLLNSIDYRVQYDDRSIWIELHLEDYYKWVENGREPGKFPPQEAILEWVKVKPVIPDGRNGDLPTEKELVFLISRKIAKQGIEPGFELRETMRDLNDSIEDRIDDAIARDVEAGLDILFSSFFNQGLQ